MGFSYIFVAAKFVMAFPGSDLMCGSLLSDAFFLSFINVSQNLFLSRVGALLLVEIFCGSSNKFLFSYIFFEWLMVRCINNWSNIYYKISN